MSETDILDGVGNEVVYFFGNRWEAKFTPSTMIFLFSSVVGVVVSCGDCLVLHLCGGACGSVSHSGGEKSSGWRQSAGSGH